MDSHILARRKTLVSLVKKLSYREGDFTLASGAKSAFYIDVKQTSLHPQGAELLGELIVDTILDAKWKVEGVGGLTLGADALAIASSLAAWRRGLVWPAFIVRKEPKGHGTQAFLEGAQNLRTGACVAVLEDVVTTGESSLKAIERLRAAGFHPVGVVGIVDREQGGTQNIQKAGLSLMALMTLEEVKRSS